MNIRKIALALLPFLAILAMSCNNDIEEFRFTGTVVGAEMCSSTQIGYIINIITPDSLGKQDYVGGKRYEHLVMGYRASRILYQGDTINAVGYFTESYAVLNCLTDNGHDLPEVILLSVDE